MHIRHYLAALALVNAERARRRLPPLERLPGGRPADARRCVIANALPGATVTRVLATSGEVRRLPPEVLRFVHEFDQTFDPTAREREVDPAGLVEGGIEDDKGCLVGA